MAVEKTQWDNGSGTCVSKMLHIMYLCFLVSVFLVSLAFAYFFLYLSEKPSIATPKLRRGRLGR